MEPSTARSPWSLLHEAARLRLPCHVRPRRGAWQPARLVRVDAAGAVVVCEAPLRGGEEVRVWLELGGRAWTFEASVLRLGVPVPDRSQHGALLGFIEGWREAADGPPGELGVGVALPGGGTLPLGGGPARVIELSVDQLVFAVDEAEPLKFVRDGRLRVELRRAGGRGYHALGRVVGVERATGTLLYTVRIEEVEDVAAHQAFVSDWERCLEG